MNDRDFAMSILVQGHDLSRFHVHLRHGRDLLVYWIGKNSGGSGIIQYSL